MSTSPTLEEHIARVGISYGKKQDIAYRSGMVLQVLGAAVLAVLYPMESPFYSAGIMLFELGALLSGIYLLVWMSWIKKIILGAILAGIPIQILGLTVVPPDHALTVTLAGIGLVCIGTAGMAGKEAYCFAYREGWILLWLYPVLVIANLAGKMHHVLNAIAFSAHFLLLLSLVGKMLKRPLLSTYPVNNCGIPEKNAE